MSAPVFVEDEGVNSGAEVEGVEAILYKRTLLYCTDSSFCESSSSVELDSRCVFTLSFVGMYPYDSVQAWREACNSSTELFEDTNVVLWYGVV